MLGLLDRRVDERAFGMIDEASPEVARGWRAVQEAVGADPPELGLAAGDRPAAEVEVLAGAMAACEYLLATRMESAAAAGCLPLGERGGLLAARGWSVALARRLSRCAALAQRFASVAAAWAAGVITSEHVDPLARAAHRFTEAELGAVVEQLEPRWGAWSPAAVERFVTAAQRMLHPPEDPSRDELDAYQARSLSFSLLGDSVLLSGQLPRVEGELVIAAIDALADRLRSTAESVPAGARRADALVQLVNDAHAADVLPARGGLPVALTVTLQQTAAGDDVWQTGRGHLLTGAEARWAACDAAVTPVLVGAGRDDGVLGANAAAVAGSAAESVPAARIAALAATLFDTRIPLDVGRTQRTATAAQRRALGVRDGGCIIPGCGVPAESCQTHHLEPWAQGGQTAVDAMALLCWAHHRQVDLGLWTIERRGADARGGWPGNNGSPFVIRRVPRSRWQL